MPTLCQQSDSWLQGPGLLLGNEEIWLTRPFVLLPLDDNPELKRDSRLHATSVTCADYFCDLFSRFCVHFKLLKVVAWVLRCKNNLLQCLGKSSLSVNYAPHLSCDEIESATLAVVKVVQLQSFPDLIRAWSESPKGDIQSAYHVSKQWGKLYPFMHDGVICVGGRLQRSNLLFDVKLQILLPSKHLVTELIIQHIHSLCGVSGSLHVLPRLRKRYWVPKGHSCVKRVLGSCREYRLWRT